MSDPFSMFEDLDSNNSVDSFYPGSKRKRRDTPLKTSKQAAEWSAKPVVKEIRGKKVEMYTVGALARALNKSEVSIRLWIRKGYLPSAPFRLPAMTYPDGKVVPGRRLYTKEMIDSARGSFERRGLVDSARIEWSTHADLTQEIIASWNQIKASVTNSDTTAEIED